MKENKISVVVVSKNEEKNIRHCLQNIIAANYKNKEIIVVDSSSDKTPEIVRKFKSVKLIRDLKGPLGHSRNLGWQASHGKYIAFVDADMRLPKDFLGKLLSCINENVGIVGCRKMPLHGRWLSNSDSLSLHLSKLQWVAVTGQPTSLECGGSIYSKRALESVGGFKEVVAAEDPDVASKMKKAGFRLAYTSATYCYNDFPWTSKRWAYQLASGGASGLNWKYIPGFVSSFPRGLLMAFQGLLTADEKLTSLTLFFYYPLKWFFLLFGGIFLKMIKHKPYSKLAEIEAEENE